MSPSTPPSRSEQSEQWRALMTQYIEENGLDDMTAAKLDAYMKAHGLSAPTANQGATSETHHTRDSRQATPAKRKYYLCAKCGYYSRFKETYAEAKSGLVALLGLAVGFGVLYRQRKKYGCLNCGNTDKNKLEIVLLEREPSPIIREDDGSAFILR